MLTLTVGSVLLLSSCTIVLCTWLLLFLFELNFRLNINDQTPYDAYGEENIYEKQGEHIATVERLALLFLVSD